MLSGDEYYGDEITSPVEQPVRQHVASFVNRRGDIEATVTRTARGTYAVRVVDVDCGETLPAARHFKAYGDARAYALQCVTTDTDSDLPF